MSLSKIILVSGGTGGHVFPAIALSEEMKRLSIDHDIITDIRCKNIFKTKKLPYKVVNSSSVSKNFFLTPIYFIKIFFGLVESVIFFIKKKPSLVIGFGGYTSFPSILAARLLKIPIILHEQNAIMGRANKFLSRFSDFVALTFRKTIHAPKKSVHTGIPIRREFFSEKKISKNSKLRILVLGGSQGATIFSKILPEIITMLNKRDLKKFSLIQQARKADIDKLCKLYVKNNFDFTVKDFFTNITEEMSNADIIISRCGASTLAEINACSKFSILFPLLSAKDNHQYENAKQFSKENQCMIIKENELVPAHISKVISKYISNKKSFIEKKKKIVTNNNATHKMIELIKRVKKSESSR
ncbi:undecaprenyldiphospho-muramoylpentapeptide beta-N-acetylglucosaminyltransferase [Rickettsiales bacterium]|nr:undecaprenyldiphospho-muramoylpentapeptide beta-N-acetylglucosaminyltransferase [Rickettsiales bacterium]